MEKVAQTELSLRDFVDDVRKEWKTLWRERIDDKVKAEGMANRDFSVLFVERGTVIVATRSFRPVDLREILRCHGVGDAERFIPPNASTGGWRKFSRSVLNKQSRARAWKNSERVPRSRDEKLQRKKGGRGWLHYSMEK